jgi:transcriptional regulator with XRE-family HTH domain
MSIDSGKRVRASMALAGIRTATELGRKLNITRQFASRLMSGEAETDSFDLLIAMESLFGVSDAWLRTGSGSPSPRADLTPNEARMIDLYRKASHARREAALDALTGGPVHT